MLYANRGLCYLRAFSVQNNGVMKKALKYLFILILLFVAHFVVSLVALFVTTDKYCGNGKTCPILSYCSDRPRRGSFMYIQPVTSKTEYYCRLVPWIKNPYVFALFGVSFGPGPEPPW